MSNFPEIIENQYILESSFPSLKRTVSARELHKFLIVGRQFNGWILGRVEAYGFQENIDYVRRGVPNGTGFDYHVSIDMAKELAMVERNDKGREVRKYFIECENKLQQPVQKFQIPQNFAEALRLAADQQEIIQSQAAQIEQSKPMLVVYEALANRRMDCNTTTLAKQLGTTATKLNTFLKSAGVKFKHQDLPMATHSDWFNVVTGVAKNGYETIQCLITPLGQIEIAKLWGEK